MKLSLRNPYRIGPGILPRRLVIKRFNEEPAPLCSLGILLTIYPPIIGSKALAKKKNKKRPTHKKVAELEYITRNELSKVTTANPARKNADFFFHILLQMKHINLQTFLQ